MIPPPIPVSTPPISTQPTRPGIVALLSVLVLAAVGSAIAVTLLTLGLHATRTSQTSVQSAQARGLADACVENALEEIRTFTPFVSAGTPLTFESGSCIYAVSHTGIYRRRITAEGEAGSAIRKVVVTLDRIHPHFRITSWQEVADF